MIVSMRRRSGDPRKEAFTDHTYALLDELREEFRRRTGDELGQASGVLVASDFLIATAGDDEIRWDRFDVASCVDWLVREAPGLVAALPQILCDLAIFTDFLAETGRYPRDRAEDVAAAFESFAEIAARAARPNRAERRAAKRAERRGN